MSTDPCDKACRLGYDKSRCFAANWPHWTPGIDPREPEFCKLAGQADYERFVREKTESPPRPAQSPRNRVSLARRLQLVTCLYKECRRGCEASKCWWKDRPVTLKECHECHP